MLILGIDPGTRILGYSLLDTDTPTPRIVAMDVLYLRLMPDFKERIKHIHSSTLRIIDSFHPDQLAIEAPFFGKNVQSMLKLGRAQGVAIAAAINHSVPITEYAPMKIKMAITGNGNASKEQVAGMLQRMLHLDQNDMPKFLDATDALAAAYCHYLQMGRPDTGKKGPKSWKEFISSNPDKVSKRKE